MPSLSVFAQLHTSGPDARQKVIDALHKVSVFSKEQEPEVFRYAITVPRDASDDKSLYVIEEYADQAAFDKHMASPPLAELLGKFQADPTLFTGAPNVFMTETSSSFTRPEVTKSSDPFITYAAINYKEGKRDGALEGWKVVTSETQKNEPETLAYAIVKDKDNALTVRTLEVYANEKYFREVHAPSKAVAENRAKYGDEIRTSISHVFLKQVGGFIHAQRTSSNL